MERGAVPVRARGRSHSGLARTLDRQLGGQLDLLHGDLGLEVLHALDARQMPVVLLSIGVTAILRFLLAS